MIKEPITREWPPNPYKGLSFYTTEDAPLLVGREQDVYLCARGMYPGNIRLVLLHGYSGCGKSSFVRAGLIPVLEREFKLFWFMDEQPPPSNGDPAGESKRAGDGTEARPRSKLFIRCTDNPLAKLAAAVYEIDLAEFAREAPGNDAFEIPAPQHYRSAACALRESCPAGLAMWKPKEDVANTRDNFVATANENSAVIVDLISRITAECPGTLVIVLDQVEEVLTLKPAEDGLPARQNFFALLSRFAHSNADARIIMAFRTEYHGRLYSWLQWAATDAARIYDYYLKELTPKQVKEAITRPTGTTPVFDLPSPRNHYKFLYEDGVPERIVAALQAVQPSGQLAAMQLVCTRLLQRAKQRPSQAGLAVIGLSDYEEIGGMQGEVDRYIGESLEQCWSKLSYRPWGLLATIRREAEVLRWRDVLLGLVRVHPDGTVTSDVCPRKELRDQAIARGCRLDFDAVTEYLAGPSGMLRRVKLVRFSNHAEVDCLSLEHDVLAFTLDAMDGIRRRAQRSILVYRTALATVGLAVAVFSVLSKEVIEAGFALVIAPGFLGLALISSRPPFEGLHSWLYEPYSRSRSEDPSEEGFTQPTEADVSQLRGSDTAVVNSEETGNVRYRRLVPKRKSVKLLRAVWIRHSAFALCVGSIACVMVLLAVLVWLKLMTSRA